MLTTLKFMPSPIRLLRDWSWNWQILTQWLINFPLWIVLSLSLVACGGGSDEPSNLLVSTGGNVGGNPPAAGAEGIDVSVSTSYQELVPSGSSTLVRLITFEKFDPADENAQLVTEPNVTFEASIVGGGILENVPKQTDRSGEAVFAVSHPGDGNVLVTIQGTGRYQGGFSFPIYFGASVSSQLVTQGPVNADGQTPAEIRVFARDAGGVGISNMPVALSFSMNSYAVAVQGQGVTGANGEFATGITNTVPQTVKVTPVVGGMSSAPLTLVYDTATVMTVPQSLDLVVKTDNVRADGQAEATLVVIARDAYRVPIPNIPISLSSDSATALLKVGGTTNTLFARGNTGYVGSFELNISNTVEESVTITAITTSGNETEQAASVTISFSNEQTATGLVVGKIELDAPINNGQPADGESIVSLRGRVLDEAGQPIPEAKVSLIVSGGSAQIELVNEGITDASGRFFAALTDQVVESFSAKAVIGEVESNMVTVQFTAIPPPEEEETETEILPTPPRFITLLASPERQDVDDGTNTNVITLTASVRDTRNTPMQGINVRIAASSDTAIFDTGQQQTGAGGTATFKVSNTVPGSFEVTATAWVEDSTGKIVGQAISDTRSITFANPVTEIEEVKVTRLIVNLVNNDQVASGDAPVRVDVIARDNAGRAVAEAPIIVQMSAGSAAVARPARGNTDENGFFSTEITSTVAGEVAVIIAVEGTAIASSPVIARFVSIPAAEEGEIKPVSIGMEVLNSPQPADGQAKISLVVTPRDLNGTPLSGVDIQLISDSPDLIFAAQGGTTNPLGQFRTTVTSTLAGTFNITPVADQTLIGIPTAITFIPAGSGVGELIVSVANNNQTADGQSPIRLDVIARDGNGRAVAGAPISVQISRGATAIARSSQTVTDENGYFMAEIVSTVAGDVAVTVAIEGTPIVHPPVIVTFKTAIAITPTTIESRLITAAQPADGQSKVEVLIIPRDAQGAPITGVPVELISESGTAVVNPTSTTTNALGEARFTITDTVAETVKLTPIADGVVGAPLYVNFTTVGDQVASLVVSVINNNQLASGKTEDAIEVTVVARDSAGRTVAGVPIVVQMPLDTAAIASPFEGVTAADSGIFRTQITSPVVGELRVNFSIKGTAITQQAVLNFTAGETGITPQQVEIIEVRNSPQPADGTSTITLVVMPRDQNGAPIPGINIELVSNPANLTLPPGKTNALGEYHVTVSSTQAGTFSVTPIASKEGEAEAQVVGQPVSILFLPIGTTVADLTVTVVNNNQPADGSTPIQLNIVARDSGGRAVSGVPIAVQLPTGTAAIASPAKGITDGNGAFTSAITSTVAGEVAVTVAIENTSIARPPVILNFTAQTGITPETVELLVLNAPQPADGTSAITLVAIPRDARGSPTAAVPIELIHDSATATIVTASGTTNALGEFRTTITNTVAETVNVTPIASDGAIIGQAIPVTFTPKAIPIPATLTLTVEYPSGQTVGASATLTVFAYDQNRVPLNGVPITLFTSPGAEPPDVSSTVKFDATVGATGTTGNQGASTGNGTFSTTVTNSQAGTFNMVARVTGTSLSSNAVQVTFEAVAGDGTGVDVQDLSLITNYPQLGTNNKNPGDGDGVIITAILKDKDNNLLSGVDVKFSADSGEIRPIEIENSGAPAGKTDSSGRAQALLTTVGSKMNRVITVTATVASSDGETKTASLTVRVTGTTITVNGENSIILGGTSNLTILLTDSGSVGLVGEVLTVESALGNTLSTASPVTNASGQATVTLTANVPGQDTITVSKEGATSGSLIINISDDNFILVPVPENTDLQRLALNTAQEFVVRWTRGGVPQALQQINLSSTRGELPATVTTDINGEARFSLTSSNAGPAQLKATVATSGGPSRQIAVNFVATRVANMTLQADPSTIGVNSPGAGADVPLETSRIIAILRDTSNNLVEGKLVNFTLIDNTGGNLSVTSATTDQFGQANTVYTAGASSSASEGVTIVATAVGETGVNCAGSQAMNGGCAVRLTVALKRVYISLGTGNKITIADDVTYHYPYKALATDINGAPIPNTEIVLSVVPLNYRKGFYVAEESSGEEDTGGWAQQSVIECPNEDVNYNGILDSGEDINKNNRLDPGGIVTFAGGTGSVVEGSTVKIKTGNDGYADFNLSYFKEMANWITVRLTARALVAGSEDQASVIVTLSGAAEDFNNAETSPPGRRFSDGLLGSPFGVGGPVIPNSEGEFVYPDSFLNATCENDL